MNKYHINNFVKGWFIGNFLPTLIQTKDFEIAVKYYQAGDGEAAHYHKIATEYTVIIKGSVRMDNQIYQTGDIIEISPEESVDFEALEETATVVVKIPSVKNDKYIDSN